MEPLSSEQFEALVEQALRGLPMDLASRVSNLEITVDDAHGDDDLLGLYEGVPLTSRDHGYFGVLPDRITLYQRSIEKASRDRAELAEVVRRTVLHELAHHFGIDEDRLEELGWD